MAARKRISDVLAAWDPRQTTFVAGQAGLQAGCIEQLCQDQCVGVEWEHSDVLTEQRRIDIGKRRRHDPDRRCAVARPSGSIRRGDRVGIRVLTPE